MIDVYIWIGVWVVILIMLIISLTEIENRIAEDEINKMFEYLKKRKKERLAMARYIDADALIESIKNDLWDWESLDEITSATVLKQTITDIQNAPTADVVEVVRCKECRFFDHSTDFTFCKRVEVGMDEDDYCSLAERKTDDDRNG